MSPAVLPDATPVARFRSRGGFTLVEVLAAFLILTIFAVVVQRASLVAQTGLSRAAAWTEAEAVARTLLEGPLTVGGGASGERSGTSDGHDWTVSTELLSLPAAQPPEGDSALAAHPGQGARRRGPRSRSRGGDGPGDQGGIWVNPNGGSELSRCGDCVHP
jgi:type II secretory pathway pseudopilin PulG